MSGCVRVGVQFGTGREKVSVRSGGVGTRVVERRNVFV